MARLVPGPYGASTVPCPIFLPVKSFNSNLPYSSTEGFGMRASVSFFPFFTVMPLKEASPTLLLH